MRIFIVTFFFLLFFFVAIKDIYDSNRFLTEDIRLLEQELGKKDSIVMKLEYDNSKLNTEIKKLTEIKKSKKPYTKTVITKQELVVEEVIPEIIDTIE